MQKALHLAPGVALSLDYVTGVIGGFAQREGGKTYLACREAEELASVGAQFIIMDMAGNFWGLRLNKDGKTPGIPVPVFGGLKADVPFQALVPGRPLSGAEVPPKALEANLRAAGTVLARIITERNLSAIIDFSQLEIGDMHVLAAAFCKDLFLARARAPRPTHIIFDEAREFAPQNLRHKGQKTLLDAVARIIRTGRNHGLGASLYDQRPQDISAEVRGQIQLLMAGRMLGDLEMGAVLDKVREWGPAMAKAVKLLPTLSKGDFIFFQPSEFNPPKRVHISERDTFDSSKTPSFNEFRPTQLTALNLTELGAEFAQLAAQAEASSPEALQKRVRELEAQLAARDPAGVAPEELATAIRCAEQAETKMATVVLRAREALMELGNHVQGMADRVRQAAMRLEDPLPAGTLLLTEADTAKAIKSMGGHFAKAFAQPSPFAVEESRLSDAHGEPEGWLPRRRERQPRNPGDKPKASESGVQRVVDVLASSLKPTLPRGQIAALLHMSPTGGGFGGLMSQATSDGLIQPVPGGYQLTTAGRARSSVKRPAARTLAEGVAEWKGRLKQAKARMLLDVLLAHPGGLAREELAAKIRLEPSGGGFGGMVKQLRNLGVLSEERGPVRFSASFLGAYSGK